MTQPRLVARRYRASLAARRRGERRRGLAVVCQALATSLMREQGDDVRERFLDGVRRVAAGRGQRHVARLACWRDAGGRRRPIAGC